MLIISTNLADFLSRADDRLDGVGWVVNALLRSCGHGDAECHKRECDESFHGVHFVMFADRQQHAANHEEGFTTNGCEGAQDAEKSAVPTFNLTGAGLSRSAR